MPNTVKGVVNMTISMSRRTLVRILSFAAALVLVLSLLIWQSRRLAGQTQRTLEYRYMQNIADLTTYAQNINSDLMKAMYAKTPVMLSSLSSKLWREAGFAKNSLDALPVDYLSLQNTNKFLSQVGDYCVSLSREFARGNPITEEQRNNLIKLYEYSDTMLAEVLTVADAVNTGSLQLAQTEQAARDEFSQTNAPAGVAEGFSDFEEGFEAYPTLIYDGPFSDHIMEKEPLRLQGEKDVSREYAHQRAAKITGLKESELQYAGDEDGKMPSYTFSAEGTEISITRQGGLMSYLLRSRIPEGRSISVEDALARAEAFMQDLNIPTMASTYYEIAGNILTINYAYQQEGVTVYPDLIKISVAMDNGEILSFDSRGFLTNHQIRTDTAPQLTVEEAQQSVSELLTIQRSNLCIIPSDGLNERLCWEFRCKADDGADILVYVNAATGEEEQILILYIDENGQLTI